MSDATDTDAHGKPLYTDEAEYERFGLVEPYFDDLKQMARTAIYEQNMQTDDFVLFCIEVCEQWEELLSMLAPDDDLGEEPEEGQVILAVATIDARDYVIDQMPGCKTQLMSIVPPDQARLIVLDPTGCTIYNIKPTYTLLQ